MLGGPALGELARVPGTRGEPAELQAHSLLGMNTVCPRWSSRSHGCTEQPLSDQGLRLTHGLQGNSDGRARCSSGTSEPRSSLQALGSSDGTLSPRSAHILGRPCTIPNCEPTRARRFLQRASQSLSLWLGALTPLSP